MRPSLDQTQQTSRPLDASRCEYPAHPPVGSGSTHLSKHDRAPQKSPNKLTGCQTQSENKDSFARATLVSCRGRVWMLAGVAAFRDVGGMSFNWSLRRMALTLGKTSQKPFEFYSHLFITILMPFSYKLPFLLRSCPETVPHDVVRLFTCWSDLGEVTTSKSSSLPPKSYEDGPIQALA